MTKFAGKNMKRTAALLLCSVALVIPALGQNGANSCNPQGQMQGPPPGEHGRPGHHGGPGGARGAQHLQMMEKELNLTPDQTAKVKAIMEENHAQMMAGRDSSASQQDRRAKMMAMRQSENAKIKALLTDEQKTKLEAMEAQMHAHHTNGGDRNGSGRMQGPPPPPSPPSPPQQ